MPGSDDFGVEDDDSLFIAAATQVEASQHGDGLFTSPRPTKRRRIRGPAQLDGASSNESEWPNTDDEAHSPARVQSQYFRSTALPTQGPTQLDVDGLPQADDEYYLPGERGEEDSQEDKSAKNSKYKIAVPRQGGYFEDKIFTQTQAHLDSSPSEFRGAVWKRPKPAPPLPPPLFAAGGVSAIEARAVGKATMCASNGGAVLKQGTLNGFGKPAAVNDVRSHAIDGDAALARRLQDEEDRLSRRPQVSQSNRFFGGTLALEIPEELADLPSDAFSSSSPEKETSREVIELSSQVTASQNQTNGFRGPQHGLRQMTIFGQPATKDMTATQAAKKKHAWPVKARDEPPTHHKLDEAAMRTWVYPTNLGTVRDYQYNIVSRSLFHNTLVALPTGLGKTFIAATIMLNYYRWTTEAQMIFMAPTKPLIAQQMEACYHNVGIPRRDTVLMTGETQPAARFEQWQEKRVFFMTPQTVINDLKAGGCDPKKIVLLVVDEAHKSTGGYAYTEVIKFLRRFNSSFRVLALTATPGGTVEAVQQVINALSIARVELRTEQSLDIHPYTHEKQTDTQTFDLSDEQQLIMGHLSKALQPALDKLCSQNGYWSKDPMNLTAYGLTMARKKWGQTDACKNAPQGIKFMVNAIFTILSQIAHSIVLLKNHGIGPFYSSINEFQRKVTSGETKGKYATEIVQSEDFTRTMSLIRAWTNNPDFMGHPKLEHLREIVLGHFLNTAEGMQGSNVPPSATRVMVFASYRDSTEEICRVLKRSEPMIRPQVFVGQAASKSSEGMNQKRQNEVIQDFKAGKYNTLVATSIGEEGLDIGDVDLIVNYDASASPIRMLQRIGRTGRKRMGRVVLLMMRGKEENDYTKAKDNYVYIQKSIADAGNYEYRDEESPRILPREVQPVIDKRVVEIPIENSQPIDLNERSRRAKGGRTAKRPPKKFHMPDGVRTGFVNASRVDSDGDDSDEKPARKRKTHAKKKLATATTKKPAPEPQPDAVSVPPLGEVLLTDAQEREHERKYARLADGDDAAIIRGPDPLAHPQYLSHDGRTQYIRQGRVSKALQRMMRAVKAVDDTRVQAMKDVLDESYMRTAGPAQSRLVGPRLAGEEDLAEVDMPVPKAMPVARGRSRKNAPVQRTTSIQSAATEDGPDTGDAAQLSAKAKPGPKPKPKSKAKATTSAAKASSKPRGRPRKKTQRAAPFGSMAGEGDESSPERTPANMRIGTQGIDLGSDDTSGEDAAEDEEMDSEMEAFVAKSDEIEMASSSQRLPDDTQPPRKRLKKKKKPPKNAVVLSDIDESESDDGVEKGTPAIADADEDEENDPGLAAMMVVDEAAASCEIEEVAGPAAAKKVRKTRVVAESESDG